MRTTEGGTPLFFSACRQNDIFNPVRCTVLFFRGFFRPCGADLFFVFNSLAFGSRFGGFGLDFFSFSGLFSFLFVAVLVVRFPPFQPAQIQAVWAVGEKERKISGKIGREKV